MNSPKELTPLQLNPLFLGLKSVNQINTPNSKK